MVCLEVFPKPFTHAFTSFVQHSTSAEGVIERCWTPHYRKNIIDKYRNTAKKKIRKIVRQHPRRFCCREDKKTRKIRLLLKFYLKRLIEIVNLSNDDRSRTADCTVQRYCFLHNKDPSLNNEMSTFLLLLFYM